MFCIHTSKAQGVSTYNISLQNETGSPLGFVIAFFLTDGFIGFFPNLIEPLLAESVQASLKEIGILVEVNCTANHLDFIESGEWDIYASAFVCAPTGDPEYFFTTHCLDDSTKNRGGYHSDRLEELEEQMSGTFDPEERAVLATEMTQTILDDNAFVFASHLKMSIVSGEGVTGLTAHPCDYYEITVDLDKN